MFCPKCGIENPDNGKFCRSCGTALSNVLAVIEGRFPDEAVMSENYNDLYSSGIRNLLLGIGFFIISILLYRIPGDTFLWLLMLFPAFSLIASGVSRIVKSKGIKSKENDGLIRQHSLPLNQTNTALPPIESDYIKPSHLVCETDDLSGLPLSITEPTTRRLRKDSEKTMTLPKTFGSYD